MNYEDIKKMFQGKKVCLIGPATNLIGTNEGNNIDNYDLVCRVNSSYIIEDKLKKDYGNRTDILFSTCNNTVSNAVNNNLNLLKECKLIINPTQSHHHGCSAKDLINKATNKTIPFFQSSNNFYEKNKGYNTGILSILFILSLSPLELFIGGFDFYKKSNNLDENYIFDHNNEYKSLPTNLPHINGKALLKGNIKSKTWDDYQKKIIIFFKNKLLNQNNIFLHESIIKILNS